MDSSEEKSEGKNVKIPTDNDSDYIIQSSACLFKNN